MKKIFILFLLLTVLNFLFSENNKFIPDVFFGLHMNKFLKYNDKPWPNVPFKTWRLWDAGICWATIEPEKDKYNFDLIDKAVKFAEEHNVEPVLNIGLSPKWAAARPYDKSGYSDEITASEPKDINEWKEYVTLLAERYKGKIKYWEIWNEPDMKMFYTGSVEKMVELVKTAYKILKTADNENKIISPPVTGYLTFISWLDEFLSKGGKNYVDIIGTHFYVWSAIDTPEKSILTIERIKSYAQKSGIPDIPIWDTECGFRKEIVTKTNLQNGYIARLSVVQWFYGIDRVMFYSYDNKYIISMVDGKDYSVINNIGKSFTEVQKWLIGSKITWLKESQGNVWTAKLERENGVKAVMLWHNNDLNPDFKIDFALSDDWDFTKMANLSGDIINISKKKNIFIGVDPVLLYNDNYFNK